MVGSIISHYRIVEKIGEGGMGVVYKAEDTKLDRVVALKFLAPHLLNNDEAKRRFLREAKAAAAQKQGLAEAAVALAAKSPRPCRRRTTRASSTATSSPLTS